MPCVDSIWAQCVSLHASLHQVYSSDPYCSTISSASTVVRKPENCIHHIHINCLDSTGHLYIMDPLSKSTPDTARSNPERAAAADAGKGDTGLVPPTPMPDVLHDSKPNGPPPATPSGTLWRGGGVGGGGQGWQELKATPIAAVQPATAPTTDCKMLAKLHTTSTVLYIVMSTQEAWGRLVEAWGRPGSEQGRNWVGTGSELGRNLGRNSGSELGRNSGSELVRNCVLTGSELGRSSGSELGRNWVGTGAELGSELGRNSRSKLGRNWLGTGSELGRNWVGAGSELSVGTLGRNWVGTESELGRNWVGTGSEPGSELCLV